MNIRTEAPNRITLPKPRQRTPGPLVYAAYVSRLPTLRLAGVLLAIAGATGCDRFGPVSCPASVQPAVEVEVVDMLTGEPAAQGARGAIHEGSFIDSLRPHAGRSDGTLLTLSAGGRPGTYRVELRKPGYRDWSRSGVPARNGDCGVLTTQVRAELQPVP